MISFLCLTLFVANTWALYPSGGSVLELTPSNFDNLVIRRDEIWVVEFFAPWSGDCQSLVPEYTKAADALKGKVKVGAVNADEHKDLGGRYGVRVFPTIKIFGANKNKPEDYQGAKTAKDIVKAAFSAAKIKAKGGGRSGFSSGSDSSSKDVIELTDSNFDRLVLQSDDVWLVEFFAPWCKYCKALAPHWAEAATELKGKVKFGAIDATVNTNIASLFGVQRYPKIKFFAPGPKSAVSVKTYEGGHTAREIIQWAMDMLAASIPDPEVSQIVSQAIKTNVNKSPYVTYLCCLTFLTANLNAEILISEC